MKPKKSFYGDHQRDLFRVKLWRIVDPTHRLVKMAKVVQWDRLNVLFGSTYCPDQGRSAIITQPTITLHYLKYTSNVSYEDVVEGGVENPYWQDLSGMKFFGHGAPIDPSSMMR